ncbi:BON domain-containing protein [Undibacterium sp. CY18W]|uniref:BON domain-containing protein n=1 Tax=Undibacterium hunanense TaxID=2762292 RepID=A0ABR6ZRK3_9BURK|nr:BON domain-containing protein [Undibacterium hunanense]MBC3918468.1 BON domain-containing protein [Undibacterium hunanense]
MGRIFNQIGTAVLLCATILPCTGFAADPVPPVVKEGKSASNVDNTAINNRDKYAGNKTPEDQANTPEDRTLLAAVRRSVVQEKSLSVMAHNIKIMVDAGAVTLRGPVKTADEKSKVEKIVQTVKGVSSINNSLDVKTN